MKRLYTIFFLLLASISRNSVCAQVADSLKGDAAFLFAYYPKESLKSEFENGYKQHLEWHRQKNDKLPWYAWYVQTGSRLGLFIDGTFGISFQAFDNRVDRAGDAQDFAKTTAPYADLAFRKVYKLRKDLSTGFSLENYTPSSNIEVFNITVIPGTEYKFEAVFLKLKKVMARKKSNQVFTLYQLLSGDEHSGYLLMIPRNNFSYFDDDMAFISISNVIKKYISSTERVARLLEYLSESIEKQTSETWGYRKDLSYFPENKKP